MAKKTETTPTGKPHLVAILKDQTGLEYQIWYDNGGKFVGCDGLKPVEKPFPLPEDRVWGIDEAKTYVQQQLDDARKAEVSGG